MERREQFTWTMLIFRSNGNMFIAVRQRYALGNEEEGAWIGTRVLGEAYRTFLDKKKIQVCKS